VAKIRAARLDGGDPRMDSLWSFYYWIDDFAGHFGTVVILGAMLAGSLYWLSGAR
jgi:hypothetical protein